jgi:quinol monooxygenase YgiN
MPAVIEFTMHVKPGQYEAVLEAYAEFAAAFQTVVPEDRLILIAGDPGSGLVRGIGVFDSAELAEDVNSMPFFAAFNEAVAPHLASAPERIELQLMHLFVAE